MGDPDVLTLRDIATPEMTRRWWHSPLVVNGQPVMHKGREA
jgi:hypothetical protein